MDFNVSPTKDIERIPLVESILYTVTWLYQCQVFVDAFKYSMQ